MWLILTVILAIHTMVDGFDLSKDLPYTAPIKEDSPSYRRCKMTHRCNMAQTEFIVANTSLVQKVQVFEGGKQFSANAFFDFEDWTAGTLGWNLDLPFSVAQEVPEPQSFQLSELGPSLGDVFLNDCEREVLFDTDNAYMDIIYRECYFNDSLGEKNLNSTIRKPLFPQRLYGLEVISKENVSMALFLFDSFYIGPRTSIGMNGSVPLAIYSLSSIVIDTPVNILPETLGVSYSIVYFESLLFTIWIHPFAGKTWSV